MESDRALLDIEALVHEKTACCRSLLGPATEAHGKLKEVEACHLFLQLAPRAQSFKVDGLVASELAQSFRPPTVLPPKHCSLCARQVALSQLPLVEHLPRCILGGLSSRHGRRDLGGSQMNLPKIETCDMICRPGRREIRKYVTHVQLSHRFHVLSDQRNNPRQHSQARIAA